MNKELRTQLRQAIGMATRSLPAFGVYTSRNHVPVFERYVIGQNSLGRQHLYEITELATSTVTIDVVQDSACGEYPVRATKILEFEVLRVDGFGENLSEEQKVQSAIELLLACQSFDRILTVPRGGALRMR